MSSSAGSTTDRIAPHPSDPVAGASEAYSFRQRLSDYRELVKPRITLLVVITAAIGFALAARHHDWTWVRLIGALVGTALSCMAASVFNQAWEYRSDALMPRTAGRPLAAGRLPMGEALALGAAFTLAGQGALCLFGTHLASGLAAVTIILYALLYTPLKRVTPWALYIGAIPGAMPPLIGYAAVTGELAAPAWVVFAIMGLWQIPHFLAIGYLYRRDYANAGMAMHAVRDPSGRSSFRLAILWCLLLLVAGLLPTWLGFAGWIALGVALVAGLGFLATAVALSLNPSRLRARRMFFASLIYLPLVLSVMMLDMP